MTYGVRGAPILSTPRACVRSQVQGERSAIRAHSSIKEISEAVGLIERAGLAPYPMAERPRLPLCLTSHLACLDSLVRCITQSGQSYQNGKSEPMLTPPTIQQTLGWTRLVCLGSVCNELRGGRVCWILSSTRRGLLWITAAAYTRTDQRALRASRSNRPYRELHTAVLRTRKAGLCPRLSQRSPRGANGT